MPRAGVLTYSSLVRSTLLRQPLRATVTVLGVALGVVAIVALGALVSGVQQSIDAGRRALQPTRSGGERIVHMLDGRVVSQAQLV